MTLPVRIAQQTRAAVQARQQEIRYISASYYQNEANSGQEESEQTFVGTEEISIERCNDSARSIVVGIRGSHSGRDSVALETVLELSS